MAVLLVVLGVDVGLVPGLERLEALHDRVVGVDDLGVERAGAVALELGADEGDVRRRVEEAVRGAVERDEAAAAGDVVEQGLLLRRARSRRCWRRSSRASYLARVSRVEVGDVLGVGDVDPPAGQDRGELRGAVGRAVVALVAEEQDLQRRAGSPAVGGGRVGAAGGRREGESGRGRNAMEASHGRFGHGRGLDEVEGRSVTVTSDLARGRRSTDAIVGRVVAASMSSRASRRAAHRPRPLRASRVPGPSRP